MDNDEKSAQLRNNLRAIGYEREGTGGGCYAMARYYPAGLAESVQGRAYVYVTDDDGADVPSYGEDIVIGLYDEGSGEAVSMVVLPFNVDRYEVQRFGVDPDDESAIPEPIQAAMDAIMVEYR